MTRTRSLRTLGELKDSGYQPLTLRQEMRKNLIRLLETGEPMFPGIMGYENTVVPKVENAVLAGHDMIFLGERGQGKTRIIRALTRLLDDRLPVIKGSEVQDDPFAPISRFGQDLADQMEDDLPLAWVGRSERYTEKLATPDTSVAELIGEIDPIKVAEGRYLSDELTIHFGLIPRTNRGIFAINELPDLSEKVQVSLFNILEERDLQVKGYKVQLPLDILVVATANPEDYTSRGRIITPLKDRYAAHINTHYPLTRKLELEIVDQEVVDFERPGKTVTVPKFLKELIAEITLQARNSPDINQVSGVSVRMSISNMESLISNAEKRAIRNRESEIAPRISDLEAVYASTEGKVELEYTGQDHNAAQILRKLIHQAIKTVFQEYIEPEDMERVAAGFQEGWWIEVSEALPSVRYREHLAALKSLVPLLELFDLPQSGGGMSDGATAAAIEFILEGLHLFGKLNKDVMEGTVIYNEAQPLQPLGRHTDLA